MSHPIKLKANDLRGRILNLEQEVKAIHDDIGKIDWSPPSMTASATNEAQSEMHANTTLAYRHLEDARMRLGKVIQALGGGVSCFDKPAAPVHFMDRVRQERSELEDKIAKLGTFLFGNNRPPGIHDEEWDRLKRQHQLMEEYAQVLAVRIASYELAVRIASYDAHQSPDLRCGATRHYEPGKTLVCDLPKGHEGAHCCGCQAFLVPATSGSATNL